MLQAKEEDSKLIITPELSICGYDCLDAFLELDTTKHSWEILAELIAHPVCQDIIVDVGAPILHDSCLYNARIVFYNKKVLFIRPKSRLIFKHPPMERTADILQSVLVR